eukprot:4022563-Amphidinium_carterae.1
MLKVTTVDLDMDGQGVHMRMVFCSALALLGSRNAESTSWQPLAQIILEAAYEATLAVSVINRQRQ